GPCSPAASPILSTPTSPRAASPPPPSPAPAWSRASRPLSAGSPPPSTSALTTLSNSMPVTPAGPFAIPTCTRSTCSGDQATASSTCCAAPTPTTCSGPRTAGVSSASSSTAAGNTETRAPSPKPSPAPRRRHQPARQRTDSPYRRLSGDPSACELQRIGREARAPTPDVTVCNQPQALASRAPCRRSARPSAPSVQASACAQTRWICVRSRCAVGAVCRSVRATSSPGAGPCTDQGCYGRGVSARSAIMRQCQLIRWHGMGRWPGTPGRIRPVRPSAVVNHPGRRRLMSGETEIRPFRVGMPDEAIADLRSQGVQLATVQELARYWATEYDWRRCEARLNALPQFKIEIDGVDIHFIHVKSPHPDALPLIMTHGWPGSVIELLETVGPLTDPTGHGGSAQ